MGRGSFFVKPYKNMNFKTILIAAILAVTVIGCESKETITEQAPRGEQKVVMVPSQHEAAPAADQNVPAPAITGPKIDDTAKQPGDR